jgi:hypothetical protein
MPAVERTTSGSRVCGTLSEPEQIFERRIARGRGSGHGRLPILMLFSGRAATIRT